MGNPLLHRGVRPRRSCQTTGWVCDPRVVSRYDDFYGFRPLNWGFLEMDIAEVLKICNLDGYEPSKDP